MSSSLSTFPDAEIWIVPFFGQGHLYPYMELCKQLASRSIKTSLIISSNIASNIPSSLGQFPLVQITEIPSSPPPTLQPSSVSDPLQHHRHQHTQMAQGLQNLFSTRVPPVCAIVDVMMSWTADTFKKFGVPTIGIFTSGACSPAMEHASWKAHPEDLKSGEIRLLPGLPEEMALTESDLKRKPHGPPGGMLGSLGGSGPFPGAGPRPGFPGPQGGGPRPGFLGAPGAPGPKMLGPPRPGQQPPWVEEVADSIAMVLNTCHPQPNLSVMAAGQTTPPPSIPPPPQNHPSSSVEPAPPAPPPPSFWGKCKERFTCLLGVETCVHHLWEYCNACLGYDI
ncbi:collagen alpha-1(XVI) chain-like [Mangifera indica]|uniref:collagen alpha-1(XVI) chain-like n=1 Tax=Mangifera indica TaxID=29780 RepID=UPI001CFAB5CD|nr:collagen alpha-1(XVI) chain-like [Mangifera indica]